MQGNSFVKSRVISANLELSRVITRTLNWLFRLEGAVLRWIKFFKMADMKLYVCALLCLLAGGVFGQLDTNVCNPNDFKPLPNDPVRPKIPSYYSVHTEANILNRQYTSDYHEWFDGANNRSAVHVTTNNLKTQEIYSFNTNEMFHIDEDTGICTLKKLSQSHTLWLFGADDASGKPRIFTAAGSLHFSNSSTEKHINKTIVRGIRCDLWSSCQYWSALNATMRLDWYFADLFWQTSNIQSQAPVRAHVQGKVWSNHKSRAFNHIYEFADFESTPSHDLSSVFETPDGAFCPARKNTKPLPTPPSAFHFTAEILQPDARVITRIKEYYDFDLNLVRYDFTPVGSSPQTQVHDFSTGIAYIIDDIKGNCSISNISSTGFDAHNLDATHVRIRTSKEFFYFDKTAYTYEGTKTVRNIKTDVWIAQRNDFPKPNSTTSTWQWYFATPSYVQNIADQLQFGLPVRLSLQSSAGNFIYNIYDYDEQRPSIWSYDISRCYGYTQRKDFSISLNGDFKTAVSTHLERFKYAVIKAITKAGSTDSTILTALRIYNIQIDYTSSSSIVVTFTLLDKSPLGDVHNPKKEVDLATVASQISAVINSGQFVVKLNAPGMPAAAFMKAQQYSMTPTQRVQNAFVKPQIQTTSSASGVSGGAMAGMGVALLVLFFVFGVLGMYVYYRRQGGAFLPKKFGGDGDITQSD